MLLLVVVVVERCCGLRVFASACPCHHLHATGPQHAQQHYFPPPPQTKAENAPRPGEARDVDADERDDRRRHRLVARVAEVVVHEHADGDLAENHLHAALQEEEAAPRAVDQVDRDERRDDVDDARHDGREQRRVGARAGRLEELRRVEHDRVDARQLLERWDERRDRELRPVAAARDRAVRVLDLGRDVDRLADVLELDVDVLRAADALQHLAALVLLAAQHERVGRVGQHRGADEQQQRGDGAARERDAPAVGAQVLRAVVDQLRAEDACAYRCCVVVLVCWCCRLFAFCVSCLCFVPLVRCAGDSCMEGRRRSARPSP